jgi:hypothetical protein
MLGNIFSDVVSGSQPNTVFLGLLTDKCILLTYALTP